LDHDTVSLPHNTDGLVLVDQEAGLAGSATAVLHTPIVPVADAARAADQELGFEQALFERFDAVP